jgi:hypothetical protein
LEKPTAMPILYLACKEYNISFIYDTVAKHHMYIIHPMWRRILDVVGCSFALLRRVCWPVLEECYLIVENSIQ